MDPKEKRRLELEAKRKKVEEMRQRRAAGKETPRGEPAATPAAVVRPTLCSSPLTRFPLHSTLTVLSLHQHSLPSRSRQPTKLWTL